MNNTIVDLILFLILFLSLTYGFFSNKKRKNNFPPKGELISFAIFMIALTIAISLNENSK